MSPDKVLDPIMPRYQLSDYEMENTPAVVVLCDGEIPANQLLFELSQWADPPEIYVSDLFLDPAKLSVPAPLRDKVYLIRSYSGSIAETPRSDRIRAWMRSRKVPVTDDGLQLNTFFALSVVDYSLMHLIDHFSHDYLIEKVEYETENALSPGVFPSLSLGPGQRYASKKHVIRPFKTVPAN